MSYGSLVILGRQPALGLAELEVLMGAAKIKPFKNAAWLDMDPSQVPFFRLGGSVKLARVLTDLNTCNLKEIEAYLAKTLPEYLPKLPPGKLKLGLSAYVPGVNYRQIYHSALALKKVLVKSGRSLRVVPNQSTALSSAQVLHNQLAGNLGMEIILFCHGSKTTIAQTTNVQDIAAYAARDQARPKRDPKVGMLPPKLAQIIINLANPPAGGKVLDPFCGTGVVLQEALLAGFGAYGTDLNPQMIEYSQTNASWLRLQSSKLKLEIGDAINHKWSNTFDVVATETYLGQPYAALPPREQLSKNINYVNELHKKFLQNLANQVKSGFRACLAVPAWKTPSGFKHLPILDHLKELGYNRLSFVHVKNDDLIYYREGQIVARELLVLEKRS